MTAPDEDNLNQASGGEKPRAAEGTPARAEENGGTRQFYADAHYEPAGDTTVPPRYYTPPVRQPRQGNAEAAENPDKKRFGLTFVISLCLICSLLGGIIGAVTLYAISERRMAIIEDALADSMKTNAEKADPISALERRKGAANLLPSSQSCEMAFLGVWLDERYDAVAAQYYNLPLGAYIDQVVPGSVADRAGLSCGDIIIGVDGQTVGSSADLRAAMRHYNAGDSANLILYRAGESRIVTVVFDEAEP